MKSQTLIYILSFVLLLGTISSCNKFNLKTSDSDVAVIEGYISPGDSVAIKVKKQIVYGEDNSDDNFISDLNVYLFTEEGEYLLSPLNDSLYVTTFLNVDEGEEISISFDYNDQTVTSQTLIPHRPEDFSLSPSSISVSNDGPGPGGGEPGADIIEITWSNPDADYHMIVVENIEDDPELINDDEDDDRPPRAFRNEPVQNESQELRGMSFTYYGRHRVILFRLNPEYAALYEDLNTTSLDLTAPPSNITNGLGIFTGINSDTLYVQVNEAK
jgi:hypothetical protein